MPKSKPQTHPISATPEVNKVKSIQTERINNVIKNELLKGVFFRNIEEVKVAIIVAVNFYDNQRPHMGTGMMIPD